MVTYFQTLVSVHNAPALVSVHHDQMVIWMQYSQHRKRDTKGVGAANSLQEKNSKISGIKTFPFIGYTQGKRGAQRCSKPAGRSPALKSQQRQWHISGQGEKPGEDSPAVSNGGRARASQLLCSPYGGGRDMPSQWLPATGYEEKPQVVFWVTLHCSSGTADGGQEQEWKLEWSVHSFLQQGAPCLA